jgi:2-keto-3-deoxy-galactonokinase
VTIRELEIIKAALEGDIIRQKDFERRDHPAFKEWLEDTEKLLKKVSNKLFTTKAKEQMIENMR